MKRQNFIQRAINYLVQKGLYDLYPDLQNRQPILRINSDDEGMTSYNAGGFNLAADQYQSHIWTHKAIGIIARNIAPLKLRVATGVGGDTEYQDNHPLNELLENPNPDMDASTLWEQWITDQMLGGEWGLEAVGNKTGNKIVELWGRQPQVFSVVPESYRYKRVSYYKIDDGHGDPYQLDPLHFIHFKFYNPLQPFRGLAPITAVRNSIVIDQLAQAWTRLFFKNQARPDYAVIAPEGVSSTEKQEILHELMNYSSGEQIHTPIVLEKGITDIKTFSYPPKDLEWVNQREMARDEVAAIFGVPDEMMGYGKDTYENFDTADRVLWTLTLVPLTQMRDGTLTRFFRKTGALKPRERIATDLREIPQLQEDKAGKIEQLNRLWTMGVPLNTASDYLKLGLPPVEGGDIGYISATLTEIGAQPEPAPEPEPTPPPPDDTQYQEPTKSIKKGVLEYGSTEHVEKWTSQQKRLDSGVSELKRLAKKEFQRQQNEINARLRASKSFGRGIYKNDVIPTPEELFDLKAEIALWEKQFKEPLVKIVKTIGQAELDALAVGLVFDISRPAVVRAYTAILHKVAEKTNQDTWNDLIELFQEAERNGEGIPAIQERLSAYFGDRKSDYQTERIGRTTATGASNAGSVEAYDQSEVVDGKTWISAMQPGRSRESHMEAHGQTVGIHESFTVDGETLEYPGDPNGSAGNIINCLCTVIPEVKE